MNKKFNILACIALIFMGIGFGGAGIALLLIDFTKPHWCFGIAFSFVSFDSAIQFWRKRNE